MPKYVSYDEMMEILDNKYLLPFRKDERLRGLNGIDIVRCKECKHRDSENKHCDCGALERQGCPFPVNDEYFCSYGERKDDE